MTAVEPTDLTVQGERTYLTAVEPTGLTVSCLLGGRVTSCPVGALSSQMKVAGGLYPMEVDSHWGFSVVLIFTR